MKEIIDKVGESAILEQLAEECAELAKAALKLSRVMRKENPTPVTVNDAFDNLVEEIGDVRLLLNIKIVKDMLTQPQVWLWDT